MRHRFDVQNISGARVRAPPRRNGASCDLGLDGGAGERKSRVPIEAEPERHHRDFDGGGILVIAEQDVAGAQRDIVHRTRGANPEAVLVEAAEILDACGACD